MKLTRKILASVLALVMVLLMLPAAFAAETTYKFDVTEELTSGADKDVIAAGTTFADGYYKVVGTVTQRWTDSKGYYAIEVAKNGTGAIEFTVTGTADVTMVVASTGSTNTSAIALLDAEGNTVANNEGASTVYASSPSTTLTYSDLPAGTYQLVSPESEYNRGVRVMSIETVETAAAEVEVPTVEMEVSIDGVDHPINGEPANFTYTATEAGTLTLAFVRGISAADKTLPIVSTYSLNGEEAVEMATATYSDKTTIDMVAGDTIVVSVDTTASCKLKATWEKYVEPAAELVVPGTTSVNCKDQDVTLSYTAPADGILTLTCKKGSGFFVSSADEMAYMYAINNGDFVELELSKATDIAMSANDEIVIYAEGNCAGNITAAWVEAVVEVPGNELAEGRNSFSGDITYTYKATANGVLKLNLEQAMTAADAFKGIYIAYSVNGGETQEMSTVVTNVTEIALNAGDTVVVTIETGANRTLVCAWEVSVPGLVVDGTQNVINSENNTYTYTAPADGTLTLTCNKTSASAGLGASGGFGASAGAAVAAQNFSYSINGEAAVKITNGTATAVELKAGDVIVITADAGTTGNITATWTEKSAEPAKPVEKVLVEFNSWNTSVNTVTAGENVITFTATADGTVTLQVPRTLANPNSVITVSYSLNGGEAVSVSTVWNEYTSVDVKAGDQIQIFVTTDCDRNITAYWCPPHTGGTATCTKQAVCTRCGQSYGELLEHTYGDGDECTVCGNPKTGDVFGIMVALMAASGTALVVLKKKEN